MSAPQMIFDLVEKFEINEHIYKDATQYDEENTKIEFINPFFEALGWDVHNKQKISPLYKDVEFENSIKIGDNTKSPDYAFRIGGTPKFFVEAKKPSVKIETDKNPAFQIRRYGWSAGLDLCILTDFETLAVYETTTKPDKTQSASTGRIKLYYYPEYIDKWDEIYNLFSKDAVLKGNFDNYVSGHEGIKKGTSRVDKEFLKEIEKWREILARNIALRNSELTVEELNYAVQLIIDRIIFLRIAEDRGIERYETLKNLTEKENIYCNFCKICKKADEEYNSGLFHFTKEKDNDFTVDNYTLNLNIDDKVFKEIIDNLYYPNSPYEFSVLPLEILGQVYEQFLGKIVRLTKNHRAKIEERPEVKKVGGVYYTPQTVTDYIIKHTIGSLIDDKTPDEISKITVLDPSCGSGSFLLKAYTYLLDYHLNYYIKHKVNNPEVIYKKKDNYYLTIREKKRILKNNIYGVDIDPLAVEVTKLSLLLKVLEGQFKDKLEQQRTLFHERALPNLENNIKCGNSLVSLDIYDKEYKDMNKPNMEHPFTYETEFPSVFENGGFDVIIGNPPFVRQESIKDMKEYLQDHYSVYTGTSDKYVYFFEKSLKLLKKGGYLGYICSNKYTRAKYGKKLRHKLTSETTIINYTKCEKVFKANVDTSILILKNKITQNNQILINNDYLLDQKLLNNSSWSIKPPKVLNLKNKVMNTGNLIKNIDDITIYRGVITGYNTAFHIPENIKNNLISKDKNNKEIIIPILRGRDIKQYSINYSNLYLICTKNGINVKKEYPEIYNYLKQYEDKLKKRYDKGNHWSNLRNCKYYSEFEKPKIIYGEIVQEPHFYYDKNEYYLDATSFLLTSDTYYLPYLTTLFNSNVSFWLMKLLCTLLNEKGLRYKKIFMDEFPIPEVSVEKQEQIGKYTLNIQSLYEKLDVVKTPPQKKEIQQRITLLEKEGNNKIYELYELTQEEIQIIEEGIG